MPCMHAPSYISTYTCTHKHMHAQLYTHPTHIHSCTKTSTHKQGFMQDKIIASHVTHVLADTWMLTLKCWPEMDYKHTCDTIFTHFQDITNNIYGFGRPFFAPFLPVHPYFSIFVFYPSKWRVDGSLHKAMCTNPHTHIYVQTCPHNCLASVVTRSSCFTDIICRF